MTKAKTLLYIKEKNKEINILPMCVVSSNSFIDNPSEAVEKVICFANEARCSCLIVRSSSSLEDGLDKSNAGKYESVLNVPIDKKSIMDAIDAVIKSYHCINDEEILIQPMLKNIIKSGVLFTADIDTGADYYIANYSVSEDTNSVTSGNTNNLKTYITYKKCKYRKTDADICNVIKVSEKLQDTLNNRALDIEFAVDNNHQIYVLQARPLTTVNGLRDVYNDLSQPLERIYKKVEKLMVEHPFLLGQRTIFGVMPDWNPAEILGIRPKKLAISLYKELVTDNIWAHQRLNYGYRDLTRHPLMVSLCGVPYIDTRVTFNSFIPYNLEESISEKLVNFYLDKLSKYPRYHDKIEFEIVYSCYYFGISNELKELMDAGFTSTEILEIEKELLNITKKIINPINGLYSKDIKKADVLELKYNEINHADISLVDRIYWLIEICKEYGTLPFAGIARAAFIAIQFLKSFVQEGIISQKEYDDFLASVDTVNKKMNSDLCSVMDGKIAKESFLEHYGHIRPGTYDILSQRYDEAFDLYFGDKSRIILDIRNHMFEFSKKQLSMIQENIDRSGLELSADELIEYIRNAIEGREYVKFQFTKCISRILQLIEILGNRCQIDKEDLAHLDIDIVKKLYSDLYTGDVSTVFAENIKANKYQHAKATRMKLPSLIIEPEDIYSFYLLENEPNFITQKSICGRVVTYLDNKNSDLTNKIVFIPAADPGYDFIFSKNIGGLITMYGGSNSHMAIRCAELGIPAVIGAGDIFYNEWKNYEFLQVDCLNKKVTNV